MAITIRTPSDKATICLVKNLALKGWQAAANAFLKVVHEPTREDFLIAINRPVNKILQRWVKHFDGVLNRPSSINYEAIERLPQVLVNTLLDAVPTLEEVRKAIRQLSSGKAPGSYAILDEIYKEGGTAVTGKLLTLVQVIWEKESVPQDFKDASIIHLYERKGNREACDNHPGISLLSMAGKNVATVVLNRRNDHLEQGLLPESQCGFRKDRGTIDMVFAARKLQEKCQEQNTDLYSTFVDLTKAFDSVSRDGLWRVM